MLDSSGASGLSMDFIGRQGEVDELQATLTDALSGRGSMVMMAGEAGIGKTRTAVELTALAEERGAQVFWARCHDSNWMPAYWPWIEIIRSYMNQADQEALISNLGPSASDISEIVPEISERLPHLQPPPALEPKQARLRLFDSITNFLKSVSQAKPVLLVLDDIHWADKQSLLMLEFLGHELDDSPILVVGTYRDAELSRQHPLLDTLSQLTREERFHTLTLGGLSLDEVGSLINETSGVAPAPEFVDLIYSHSEGNPLFVTELIRLLDQDEDIASEGRSSSAGRDIGIPQGLREVMGRRLRGLSELCNRILTVASVMGREFEFDALAQIFEGVSRPELLKGLEEAIGSKLIVKIPQTEGRYQLAHALLKQTLFDAIPATGRVHMHAQVAEMLEKLYIGPHAAELAYHFGEAEAELGTEKLVSYLCLAGEQALAAYAHEDALEHFQRALDAQQAKPMDSETARILFGLGRAQAATLPQHRRDEALANLSRAFDYFSEQGDLESAISVAMFPLFLGNEGSGTAGLIEKALELAPPDSHEAGNLLCQYGLSLYHETGDYETSQKVLNTAVEVARSVGDIGLELRSLANSAHVNGEELNLQQSSDQSLEAIRLARLVDDPSAEMWSHLYAWVSAVARGRLQDARVHATAMLGTADRLRDRFFLAIALRTNQVVAQLVGNWDEAREYGLSGLKLAPEDEFLLGNQTLLELEIGNSADAAAYFERLLNTVRSAEPGPTYTNAISPTAIAKVARITGRADELEEAEAVARRVLAEPQAPPVLVLYARIGLALIAVHNSDVKAATEQYAAISERKSFALPIVGMVTDHLLALLAQTLEQLDQSMAHFEDALTFYREAGFRCDLAWLCFDYAEALVRPSVGPTPSRLSTFGRSSGGADTGRCEKAVALLDESLAISTDLAMSLLRGKVARFKQDMLVG